MRCDLLFNMEAARAAQLFGRAQPSCGQEDIMDQPAGPPDVSSEIARRKRFTTLASLFVVLALIGMFEMLRRGLLFPTLVWAAAGTALVVGHTLFLLERMKCPNCSRFIRAINKRRACPFCGARFKGD